MIDPSLAAFEAQLQNTLNHFYNPLYHPDELVYKTLGLPTGQGMEPIQKAIKKTIESMRPAEDIPAGTYSRRYYEILTLRYLSSLSQEETAEKMQMTPRNLRRYQQQAVHALAQMIWENYLSTRPERDRSTGQAISAHQPLLQELEVLLQHSPDAVAEVRESLGRVREITQTMLLDRQTSIEIEVQQPELLAKVHPSVLDQILILLVEQLTQNYPNGNIFFHACSRDEQVEIRIRASILPAGSVSRLTGKPFASKTPVPEILSLIGAELEIAQDELVVQVTIRFPEVSFIPVLLIDDNPDFDYLFKRYTKHTRYRMHNIREGSRLWKALEEIHPQIIVLDVLLPDVDGWQLLIDLQKATGEQAVPVVICSALRQADLAYSLGAKAFLPKPVDMGLFIKTLNALSQQR